ncbi:V-type ATP synthase subunit C [Clostridiaceae bacterium JG1575]|nr:V-type ATP synthase subunit C [Clostridiaceae bacterium JG1575]
MDRMEYTQAVATMRVYEKRLLDSVKIERMTDAASAQDVLKILQETEYAKVMNTSMRPEEFETILSRELERVYREVYALTKDTDLIALLSLKYDYQNLKTLIKAKALGLAVMPALQNMGTIPGAELRSDFESDTLGDYSPFIQEAVAQAWSDYGKNADPQRIDLIVDKTYFAHLFSLLEGKKDVQMIRDYVAYQVDAFNLLALLRAKKQKQDPRFLEDLFAQGGEIPIKDLKASFNEPYDTLARKFRNAKVGPALAKGMEAFLNTHRLGELERQLENGLIRILGPARHVVFGPEPLFGYVAAKERENKLLRIILVSKLNNIAPERIRERLRDIYA